MNRTNAKDFTRYPELLDQHIDRVMQAEAAAYRYMARYDLLTDGLVIVPNLMGDSALDVLEGLQDARIGDAKHPSTLIEPDTAPAVRATASRILLVLLRQFRDVRRRDIEHQWSANTYRQHLYNAPGDNDIQKVFHRDTFFPALKYWYFPKAVEVDDGPFWYARRSVELTKARLEWEREQVERVRRGEVENWRGDGHAEGSFRASVTEIEDMGYEPEPVTVAPDTLVIANVFGFHRRGDTTEPRHRYSIHGSIRFKDPFG